MSRGWDVNSRGSDRNLTSGALSRGWDVDSIRADEDWKRAEAILLKYFKPYQINPVGLVGKNKFQRLIELMDGLDLDAYAKWYLANKVHAGKGFNFGLFLYPGIINEFEQAQGPDPYMTTNEDDDSKWQAQIEEQNAMFVKFRKHKEKGNETEATG